MNLNLKQLKRNLSFAQETIIGMPDDLNDEELVDDFDFYLYQISSLWNQMLLDANIKITEK